MGPSKAALGLSGRSLPFFLPFRHAVGIQRIPEHHEPVVEELQYKIGNHIDGRHQILVPAQPLRQIIPQQCGQRREHAVESEHQRHGFGHIAGGLEGVPPVQRKVPQHRQRQRNEIAGPVAPSRQLIEQGERPDLNDPRRERKQEKFQRAQNFLAIHGRTSFLTVQRPELRPVGRVQLPEHRVIFIISRLDGGVRHKGPLRRDQRPHRVQIRYHPQTHRHYRRRAHAARVLRAGHGLNGPPGHVGQNLRCHRRQRPAAHEPDGIRGGHLFRLTLQHPP